MSENAPPTSGLPVNGADLVLAWRVTPEEPWSLPVSASRPLSMLVWPEQRWLMEIRPFSLFALVMTVTSGMEANQTSPIPDEEERAALESRLEAMYLRYGPGHGRDPKYRLETLDAQRAEMDAPTAAGFALRSEYREIYKCPSFSRRGEEGTFVRVSKALKNASTIKNRVWKRHYRVDFAHHGVLIALLTHMASPTGGVSFCWWTPDKTRHDGNITWSLPSEATRRPIAPSDLKEAETTAMHIVRNQLYSTSNNIITPVLVRVAPTLASDDPATEPVCVRDCLSAKLWENLTLLGILGESWRINHRVLTTKRQWPAVSKNAVPPPPAKKARLANPMDEYWTDLTPAAEDDAKDG